MATSPPQKNASASRFSKTLHNGCGSCVSARCGCVFVADGGATACLNRCVLAALVAPPARARNYVAMSVRAASVVLVHVTVRMLLCLIYRRAAAAFSSSHHQRFLNQTSRSALRASFKDRHTDAQTRRTPGPAVDRLKENDSAVRRQKQHAILTPRAHSQPQSGTSSSYDIVSFNWSSRGSTGTCPPSGSVWTVRASHLLHLDIVLSIRVMDHGRPSP